MTGNKIVLEKLKVAILKKGDVLVRKVKVFLKGGGSRDIGLTKDFIRDLTTELWEEGIVDVTLSGGEVLDVVGFLVVGKEFFKEDFVIVSGGVDD